MADLQKRSGSEIDLIELLSIIWKGILRFFTYIYEGLLFLILFGLRRIHWLLMFIIAGGFAGYLLYNNSERIFSSEIIAQPNGFTSIEMAQYINDIHEMCLRGNFQGIARAFQISQEDALQIKNIEAFFLIDVNKDNIGDYVDYKHQFNPVDTNNTIVKTRLLIRAEIIGNTSFEEVKKGLNNYINNNPYLIAVNTIRKRELRSMIDHAEEELNKLDSLQNFEYYRDEGAGNLNTEGQIVFINEQPTQLYYRDRISLLQRKLNFERDLELETEPLTIIKDFTDLQVEENPLSGYIIKYGFFAGLAGYVLLVILVYRKSLQNYLSTKG